MTTSDNSIRVPLALLERPRRAPDRRKEPVTIGLPLPRGRVRSTADLALRNGDGTARLLQARGLDSWPDGSIRWALLDFTADLDEGHFSPLVLSAGEPTDVSAEPGPAVQVRELADGVAIDTGAATFTFRERQPFPFSSVHVDAREAFDARTSGLRVGAEGATTTFVVSHVELVERGPLRAEVLVRAAAAGDTSLPLEVFGRVECFAGTATARIAVTIRNTRRASHPGGEWVLGDPGSVLLDFASLIFAWPDDATSVRVAVEDADNVHPVGRALELYQDSSGGDHWNSAAHVSRNGIVPAAFRGYRLRTDETERAGLRASPTVVIERASSWFAAAVPAFWQHAPRAISCDARTVDVGLFPRQYADAHELQGGEQKTHVLVVAFAPDPVTEAPLAWCHDPIRVYAESDWCCRSGAVPLVATADTDDEAYRALVATALDPEQGFPAKRERFDEYGWRDFGDLPGDHESAFQPADRPFVSHYNNQYDAIAAFAAHFVRSGDARWWRLMDDLARHVRDIDVYHTREDKSAYNGGLFWHTQHYMDAATSTHRTYPKGSGGGGPSAEHNYAAGLMLHYFMTGDPASRDAAVGLGRWVLDMDDGRQTVFRWLASGATGLASATGSTTYHGPGRGPANSILACLVAHRLTGERRFREKADELIRRCIHPADDLEARNLLDVERRWYYTVFLQALGTYLHEKSERGENDEMYAYAQASLLHYARWMARHEVPYLSRPEVLEFPNETWAAQDLRKAEVFWWAAGHAPEDERAVFTERARYFFGDAVARLHASPTHHYTRPLVLALRNGVHVSWFEAAAGRSLWPKAIHATFGRPASFRPQRAVAIARARLLLAAAALGGLALLVAMAL